MDNQEAMYKMWGVFGLILLLIICSFGLISFVIWLCESKRKKQVKSFENDE